MAPPGELTVENARWLIHNALPELFHIGSGDLDYHKFKHHLAELTSIATSLQSLWSEEPNKKTRAMFEKHCGKYNKYLNYLQQHLSKGEMRHGDLTEVREAIRNMCFYECPYKFREKVEPVHTPAAIASVAADEDTRRANYDGLPITTSQLKLCITVSKTIDRHGSPGPGRAFGFGDVDEALACCLASLERATPNDLALVNIDTKRAGGYSTGDKLAIINMQLNHGEDHIGVVPSNSTKLAHLLLGSHLSMCDLSRFLEGEHFMTQTGVLRQIGLYRIFHEHAQAKIKQLISASHGRPDFPYVIADCYRPECRHTTVFKRSRYLAGTHARCQKCNIAEFCLRCTRSSHGGNCGEPDRASAQLIRENTRACPSCHSNIEKNDGCNHMSCRCGAHFCWLCNQQYTLDQINAHYAGANPYGVCRGMLNPLAPAVHAAAADVMPARLPPRAALAAIEALDALDALAAPALRVAIVPNNPRILERVAVLALQEMDRRNGVNRVLAGTDRLTIASLTSVDLDSLIDFIVSADDFDLLVERNLLVAFLLDI
jgi:hypothetical protein